MLLRESHLHGLDVMSPWRYRAQHDTASLLPKVRKIPDANLVLEGLYQLLFPRGNRDLHFDFVTFMFARTSV